jgi:hypothetical protein
MAGSTLVTREQFEISDQGTTHKPSGYQSNCTPS